MVHEEYPGPDWYTRDPYAEDYKILEKKADRKFKRMSQEEIEKYEEYFLNNIQPFVLDEMYGGYHPRGPRAEEKRERFSDYFYNLGLVHPDLELDEREDQILFGKAEEYAEDLPEHKHKKVKA